MSAVIESEYTVMKTQRRKSLILSRARAERKRQRIEKTSERKYYLS